MSYANPLWTPSHASGAFKGMTRWTGGIVTTDETTDAAGIVFQASLDNALYGKSSTNQSNALRLLAIIKS